jgi:hypothetical protein
MNSQPFRFALLALAAAAAAGCASNGTRDDGTAAATRDENTTVARRESTHIERTTPLAPAVAPGTLVGVPACDDYLASYRACHSVIGTYRPDVLDKRYDQLRATLVSQSHDPELATTLETRCNSLIAQRDEALAGRDCLTPEATKPVAAGADGDDDLFDDGE